MTPLHPAVLTVYGSALLQGLTLVSFPALSGILKSQLGLDDAQYGAIFLPQVACAVAGSLLGGALAARLGLQRLLLLSLLANALSQGLLAVSADWGGYPLLLAGTAALGLGFGLGASALNGYPPRFFPARQASALVVLHTLMGLGLAAGPLLSGSFADAGRWQGYPLMLLAACLTMGLGLLLQRLPGAETGEQHSQGGHPGTAPAFWVFALVAVLYAFAEGTFANWAVLYLAESKGLPGSVAAWALSAFWAALALGRLVVSVLVLRLAPVRIWQALPLGMLAVFLALPQADSAWSGIALFAAAGLACSGFFPLTIGLAGERFPRHVPWVASMLTAALMVGVGLGSWAVGLLREALPLETLYRYSAGYPLAALLAALWLGRSRVGKSDNAA